MLIDLHIHSKSSDGSLSAMEVIKEAKFRHIGFMSITDHDSVDCQEVAAKVANKLGIRYITGVELNVTFWNPRYHNGKRVSLDFLGYQFDPANTALRKKLERIVAYREERATKILVKLNTELQKRALKKLTGLDFEKMRASIDGAICRPHIADYLVQKGIVGSRKEAFDLYLVKCNVPKFPLYLEEASRLVRNAGGKLVLAHPNDPWGTSLVTLTRSLTEQTQIIIESMQTYIDGVECWHSRNDPETTKHYLKFARKHRLIVTGGSDCHQKPIIMGTVKIPEYVARQFGY